MGFMKENVYLKTSLIKKITNGKYSLLQIRKMSIGLINSALVLT